MTTLEDLVQEVILHLNGYTTRSEQATYLKVAISNTETRIKVDDIEQVSRGMIEIGDELVRVESVDRSASVVVTLPKGRGWRGTVAAAHAADETVTMSPLVPRVAVKQAINDTIGAVYPTLFGIADTTFVADNANAVAWQVPALAEVILDVRYRDPLGRWKRVRHWELENRGSIADFASGKSLRILGVPTGLTVQVVYGTRPTRMTDASTFADTGLDESVRELIVLGTQARLIPSLDVARLSIRSINSDELDQPIQVGSAVSLGRELRKQFQERIAEERAILQSRYPGRIHFTR